MPRVYAIENDDSIALVTANSGNQALNHVVKGQYKVRVATALDVVDYMKQGGVVEDATAAPTPESPETQDATGEAAQ